MAGLSGIFALIVGHSTELTAYTNIHRMEQLYWAEGKSEWVITTSAEVAHAVARIRSSEPPAEALLSLASAGFMLSDATPFPAVRAVPANTAVTVDHRGPRFTALPMADVDPEADVSVQVDGLTSALLSAGRAASAGVDSVDAHITGGKDSRIVAAVLHSLGTSAHFKTTGFAGNPDVEVGLKVAAALNLNHVVAPTAGISASAREIRAVPMARMEHIIHSAGGQTSAWEDLGANYVYKEGRPLLGGHGGELLRGGFAFGLTDWSEKRARSKVLSLGGRVREVLTPSSAAVMDEMFAPWLDRVAADPVDGLSQMYRELRTGRWLAVAWGAYSRTRSRRSLLADNGVVRWTAGCSQHAAANEELVHSVIHALAPELCSVQFAHGRWRFEAKSDSGLCTLGDWNQRAPFATSKTQDFNWRHAYPMDMYRHMTSTIQNSRSRQLFEREPLRALLDEAQPGGPTGAVKALWSLLSAGVVSGPRFGRRFHQKEFAIPVP